MYTAIPFVIFTADQYELVPMFDSYLGKLHNLLLSHPNGANVVLHYRSFCDIGFHKRRNDLEVAGVAEVL